VDEEMEAAAEEEDKTLAAEINKQKKTLTEQPVTISSDEDLFPKTDEERAR
jgi:hypothetical protein